MAAAAHLLRVHFGRMIRARRVLLLVVLIPVAIGAADAAGVDIPRAAPFAAFGFFAVWAAAAQAAADRASGLADGIRSTSAPDSSILVARLAVAPLLFVLQTVMLAVVSQAAGLFR